MKASERFNKALVICIGLIVSLDPILVFAKGFVELSTDSQSFNLTQVGVGQNEITIPVGAGANVFPGTLERQVVTVGGSLHLEGANPPNLSSGQETAKGIVDIFGGAGGVNGVIDDLFGYFRCPVENVLGCSGGPLLTVNQNFADSVTLPATGAILPVTIGLRNSFTSGEQFDIYSEAEGTVEVTNYFRVFSISDKQAALLEGLAAIALVAGVTINLIYALALIPTFPLVGVFFAVAASVSAVEIATEFNKRPDIQDFRNEFTTEYSTSYLPSATLPTPLSNLSNIGFSAILTGTFLKLLAQDPPRDDYLVPTGLPDVSAYPDNLKSGFLTAGCISDATTALERYQGAVLAHDAGAAWDRIGDYRALESCFVKTSNLAGAELDTLLNTPGALPDATSIIDLKDALKGINLSDFQGDDLAELNYFANLLDLTPDGFVKHVHEAVREFPDVVDPRLQVEELKRVYVELGNWAPVAGSAQVPEPSTLALLGLGLVGVLARRKRQSNGD